MKDFNKDKKKNGCLPSSRSGFDSRPTHYFLLRRKVSNSFFNFGRLYCPMSSTEYAFEPGKMLFWFGYCLFSLSIENKTILSFYQQESSKVF